MMRRLGAFLMSCALILLPATAMAQQTGTVTGRVTNAGGLPLSATRVQVVGTTVGTMTDEAGNYRLAGVAAGSQQLRAIRLGYSAGAQTVMVIAGGTATANFTLSETATTLDEVVVTATGEQQRRRESGNAVSSVGVTPERLATTTNISQLLTGKAPGVTVATSGGTTGSASRIRIRGANSVSLSNEPLVIVDGARINNDIGGTGTLGVGGQASSRLNDINPDDIESIEIIKGPAAAALYGTAAANGVIQIHTKRGRAGATRWTVFSEAGSQADQTAYPANFTQVGNLGALGTGARTTGCTLDAQARLACVANPDSLVSWNPLEQASPFITGYRTSVGLNAAGGSERARYFLSADVDRDQGVYEPNFFTRANLRANVSSQLADNVSSQVFTTYTSSRLKFPQNDNNILGVVSSALLGSAFDNATTRGYLSGQTPREIFAINTAEDVERFIGSSLTTWQVLPWLSTTGQFGVDFLNRRNRETVPANEVFFNASYIDGYRQRNSAEIWNYTANGSATANHDFTPELRSTTTVGLQYQRENVQGVRAFGAKLAAGTGSLQGTSARFAVGETNTDNRTLGALVSQQVAWRDRLFGTVAFRTDNNSAFGSNFGWIQYPAASLSWVISEEGFFPRSEWLNALRLRTAYGQSGQRPNFRDAITFFNTQTVTTTAGDIPGILVGGTGNADLKPERSTEVEIGFESTVLRDRINLEFTAYNKRTTDLLIARPLPPSLGLTGSQFANLGESSNRGIELGIDARIFELDQVAMDLGITASTNRNRLENIGVLSDGTTPIPPIVFGIQRHAEGFPLGGYWDEQFTFEDRNGDGIISRVNCPGQVSIPGGPACEVQVSTLQYLGNPLPTKEMSVNPRLTIMRNVEISALFDYRGGYKQFNNTARFRCNFGNCQEAYDDSRPLDIQARNIAHLLQTDAGYVEDSDFTKLREVSLSLLVPQHLVRRARASEARLTFAGRNLKTWTNYTGFDPEVNSTPTALFSTSDFLTQPPLRVYSARLTLSF
jgi:TonB-linked SusC/RagA family outer membrane protein